MLTSDFCQALSPVPPAGGNCACTITDTCSSIGIDTTRLVGTNPVMVKAVADGVQVTCCNSGELYKMSPAVKMARCHCSSQEGRLYSYWQR